MAETLFGEDRFDGLVEKLWKTAGWPADPVRDRALVTQLADEFPELDLGEEFGKFQVWLLANRKEVKGRGRFQRVRNWCSNARRYRRSAPAGGRGAAGARSVAGAVSARGVSSGFRDW